MRAVWPEYGYTYCFLRQTSVVVGRTCSQEARDEESDQIGHPDSVSSLDIGSQVTVDEQLNTGNYMWGFRGRATFAL